MIDTVRILFFWAQGFLKPSLDLRLANPLLGGSLVSAAVWRVVRCESFSHVQFSLLVERRKGSVNDDR